MEHARIGPAIQGRRFNPHSRKTPSGTLGSSILGSTKSQFQSSLEENPEWNLLIVESADLCRAGFNPHSRKTPSGTQSNVANWTVNLFQSSLEENPEWNIEASLYRKMTGSVSILTRGKPRVELRARGFLLPIQKLFQSSLEENPEWNSSARSSRLSAPWFQSSLEENPEWNLDIFFHIFSLKFQSSLEENPEWNKSRAVIDSVRRVSILTRGKPRVEPAKVGLHDGVVLCFNPHSRKTPSGTQSGSRVV